MGLTSSQVARLCEALGQYCGSSAMIFAMHQIQVACVVHHAQQSAYFRDYLRRLVEEQRLIASATTEVGVGGDLRSSIVRRRGRRRHVPPDQAGPGHLLRRGRRRHPRHLPPRRRTPPPSDQVQVLVRRADCTLEPPVRWDTLGFRGTCSSGFT